MAARDVDASLYAAVPLVVFVDRETIKPPRFEQAFNSIDHVLHKDAGCSRELDYTEQSSWLLFLKCLDALEAHRATEATLLGRDYTYILEPAYRWSAWAAPKAADGSIDHNTLLTGDDLIDFVDQLRFSSNEEKHEPSHLYEAKIACMGNAGRNGGEYYTPPTR